jgi:hypothetical protein
MRKLINFFAIQTTKKNEQEERSGEMKKMAVSIEITNWKIFYNNITQRANIYLY